MSRAARLDQRVLVAVDDLIDVGAAVEQQRDHLRLTGQGGDDQRVAVAGNAEVRIGAAIEQQPNSVGPAGPCGRHQHGFAVANPPLKLVLFEGGDTTGKVLWQLTLERDLELGNGRSQPPAPSQELIPKSVRLFAREALDKLPLRDPVAAHP